MEKKTILPDPNPSTVHKTKVLEKIKSILVPVSLSVATLIGVQIGKSNKDPHLRDNESSTVVTDLVPDKAPEQSIEHESAFLMYLHSYYALKPDKKEPVLDTFVKGTFLNSLIQRYQLNLRFSGIVPDPQRLVLEKVSGTDGVLRNGSVIKVSFYESPHNKHVFYIDMSKKSSEAVTLHDPLVQRSGVVAFTNNKFDAMSRRSIENRIKELDLKKIELNRELRGEYGLLNFKRRDRLQREMSQVDDELAQAKTALSKKR